MNCKLSTRSPLVSIIIPCYKQAQYLAEAIDSALAQTYSSVEIIVINDGSPDNTAEVCRCYGSRIRYIEQENKGVCEARNNGIRQASGEYILTLDADDKLTTIFLDSTVPPIVTNPNIGFIYTNQKAFGGSYPAEGTAVRNCPWNIVDFLMANISVTCTVYRKSDWERVGGYCNQFLHGIEDWDFSMSLIETGKVGHHVDMPLFYYRRHSTGSRHTQCMTAHFSEAHALLVERHRPLFEEHWPAVLAEWCKRYQESFAYILKVEPLLEEYYRLRPGRLEKCGVPSPIARLIRKLRKL